MLGSNAYLLYLGMIHTECEDNNLVPCIYIHVHALMMLNKTTMINWNIERQLKIYLYNHNTIWTLVLAE